jgi:aspartate/methionine/tyrosine aminotransferase
MSSEYMLWAKMRSHAKFNLATSGVMAYPISELGITVADLEISGPSWYGYAPLQKALAVKCGVSPDNVVAATGTSMANHLAMAALLKPGDEVIIEHPAYDPMTAVADYLGTTIKRFARRFENGFKIDLREIEHLVTTRTRLIVLTNLHNPTGAFTDEATLIAIGEIAKQAAAHVLVDEVYLEALFDKTPRSAFHLGDNFVVTSSLTKVYGLSGLRCGWVLATADLATRMWRLNDLFGNIPAHTAELLSVTALGKLDQIAARSRALIEGNREVLNRFLDSREDLDCYRSGVGTTVFPRLKRGSVEGLCATLRNKYETTVVPGSFFGMPEHFRLGIGCEPKMLVDGLERLGEALDEQDHH